MYYSDDLIEEIRSRNDIIDVISGYVKLKRQGATYFGLCPFHNEKSPSFSVTPGKQMYYCFGCGEGGNVYSFIMKYENYTFLEAVKMLADRAGIQLPETEYTEEEKRKADLKAALLGINKQAALYFHHLLKSEKGKTGLDYFSFRGLDHETIVRFGLGYSNKTSDDLYRYFKQQNYSDELLKETGLFAFSEKGTYDKFWNRVMFPILDINNRVIGFGGRVMGEGEPKYLNSPETKIFEKSRNLYGMNFARISRKPYILICEGYMDVIALHRAGFTNAVAALGTAFTQQHAMLIKRYVKEAVLTFDSDGAGQKAALRAIPILKSVGIAVKVLDMKPYKDPDEFIRNLGAEEYQKRLDNAMPLIDYKLKSAARAFDLERPDDRRKYVSEAIKIIKTADSAAEQEDLLKQLRDATGLTYESLRRDLDSVPKDNTPALKIAERKDVSTVWERASRFVLAAYLFNSKISKTQDISGVRFANDVHELIAKYIKTQLELEERVRPAELLELFDEGTEEYAEVTKIFDYSDGDRLKGEVAERYFNDSIRKLRLHDLDEKINRLQLEVAAETDLLKRKTLAETITRLTLQKTRIKHGDNI